MTLGPTGFALTGLAFARARWRARALSTPQRVADFQSRRLEALMAHARRAFPYYRALGAPRFDALPVLDKAALMARFPEFNVAGLDVDTVRATIARGEERIGRHVVGQSTGTSGNRGLYVIDDAERYAWLGTLLAKALPDALWRRHRVALAMPNLSRLYESAGTGSRIELRFFDLALGVDAWADGLHAFAPDTVVAPPKVLRRLAETGRLAATHLFSGAEVLDPIDREVIEGATRRRVREIYMATEGLFGVACPHGTLHLAEDVVHIDWTDPKGAPGSPLRVPIVTDFTRRAQALIRYRMNDLLLPARTPCPCGSAFRAIERVEGRQDDCLLLPGADGTPRFVTPDVPRNAVVDASRAIRDFRVVQTGAATLVVTLDAALPPQADAQVMASLRARLATLGVAVDGLAIEVARGLSMPVDRKLRRVRREWAPDRDAGLRA